MGDLAGDEDQRGGEDCLGLYIYIFGWLSGGQALKDKGKGYIYIRIYVEVKGEGGWGLEAFNVRMVLLLFIPENIEDVLATHLSLIAVGGAYAQKPCLLRLLLQRMT